MQSKPSIVVVLGTGGTIAGTAVNAADNLGYTAAQLTAARLIAGIPALNDTAIEVEQVAQIDSKDMGFAVWRDLAIAVSRHLQRADVCGIVVTHGSDTLEETAYFLQRVIAPNKPVVLVAAMRPATSTQTDGPQNLIDAVHVARMAGARGVVAVLAGTVHSAIDVRKNHTYRLDAFSSGDAGALAHIEQGILRCHRDWPTGDAVGIASLPADVATWPQVEIVTSHAESRPTIVTSLHRAGVKGIVVAATGNGTLHAALESALLDAQTAGVAVWRSSRCLDGNVSGGTGAAMPAAGTLTPVQARIELMLSLLKRGAAG